MADIVSKQTRSRMMSSVRSKDTKLEREIRRRLFNMGFRFRLHRKDLPGRPDMVFPKYSAVIFIHGCFWHLHGCHRSKLPETRQAWWKAKLEANRNRDITAIRQLRSGGWRVMIVWECITREPGILLDKVLNEIADSAAKFLQSGELYREIPKGVADLKGQNRKNNTL
jgi:DNA mismatch endonuclease, patch repair protein